jgi:hypothetical protein
MLFPQWKSMTAAPPAPVPIQQIEPEYGTYIRAVEAALKAGDGMAAFTQLAKMIRIEKTNAEVRKLRGLPPKTRENMLRTDLFSHYAIHAPFFTEGDIVNFRHREIVMPKHIWFYNIPSYDETLDILLKFLAARTIFYRDIQARVPILGKSANTLRNEQMTQLLVLVKSLRTERKNARKLYEKYSNAFREDREKWQREKDEFEEKTHRDGEEENSDEIRWAMKKRYYDAVDRVSAFGHRDDFFYAAFKEFEPELALFLIKTHSKNGAAIRSALRQCGYTPEECRGILEKVPGDKKENAYLLQGLPMPKPVSHPPPPPKPKK